MSIEVFAPASIGNFSVGYDLLGAAISPIDGSLLGDVVRVDSASDYQLITEGNFAQQLPANASDNIVHQCYELFHQKLERKGVEQDALLVTLEKNLPVGSGLGSSSSSIVAAFAAFNQWYQEPFSSRELLLMMGNMEAQISGSLHYDNIAPCYLGGLQLMSADESISNALPWFDDWYIVVANPGTNILTKAAREAIPSSIDLTQATAYAQNLANFISSLYRQDKRGALYHLKDVIAEPYRYELLPNFQKHKAELLGHGASAMGISGSGPTIFAVCENLEAAHGVHDYLAHYYNENDRAFSHICQLNQQGAQQLSKFGEDEACRSSI
ncbi:homoserine kinase [Kangiella taiwanensis]|uniref:Homoserine kinase n=1 Tax=Kangiella taiwanensis TaxID=1079179 RepID=A0ABP8I3V8_9GAMM|nr:homoserine kinase [Kangiella taiwanensis]